MVVEVAAVTTSQAMASQNTVHQAVPAVEAPGSRRRQAVEVPEAKEETVEEEIARGPIKQAVGEGVRGPMARLSLRAEPPAVWAETEPPMVSQARR